MKPGKVVFDEDNLGQNEKYFKENPTKMKITEPKTPWANDSDPQEKNISFANHEDSKSSWNESYNQVATKSKSELENNDISEKELFVKLRKKIYADEGKKFKEREKNN